MAPRFYIVSSASSLWRRTLSCFWWYGLSFLDGFTVSLNSSVRKSSHGPNRPTAFWTRPNGYLVSGPGGWQSVDGLASRVYSRSVMGSAAKVGSAERRSGTLLETTVPALDSPARPRILSEARSLQAYTSGLRKLRLSWAAAGDFERYGLTRPAGGITVAPVDRPFNKKQSRILIASSPNAISFR